MFEELRQYRIIFVAAPWRAGSTICARMIGADTGHDVVLEDDFGYSNIAQLAAFIGADYGPIVVQCPFLTHLLHDLEFTFDVDMRENMVVMVHRYRPDIIASERRAKFPNGNSVAFDRMGERRRRAYHSDRLVHSSDVVYECWEDQSRVLPNAMDIGYLDLQEHPLWQDNRSFSLRQTSADDEGPAIESVIELTPGEVDAIRITRNL